MRRGPFLLSVALLTAFYLGISAAIVHLGPSLFGVYDTWFGTNIPRHIQWATDPEFVFRAHLHPVSFLIYKALGVPMRLLHVRTHVAVFVACSLPAALLTSLAITHAADGLAPARRLRPLFGLACVAIGATMFYATIPESQAMSGACLLTEGIMVFRALRARQGGAEDGDSLRLAWAFVTLAAGITLSNAVPGLVLLLPLYADPARRRGLGLPLSWMALAIALAEAAAYIAQQLSPQPGGPNNLSLERDWMARPTAHSLWVSLSTLFLHLFGLPPCHLTVHHQVLTGQPPYPVIYPRMWHSPVQCAAGLLWVAGLVLWWRRPDAAPAARAQIAACLVALLGLVCFSSFYDTFEAYMVSSHAWPFVLLPALLVLRDSWERRALAPLRCMGAVVALSVLQTVLSLPHTFFLLTLTHY